MPLYISIFERKIFVLRLFIEVLFREVFYFFTQSAYRRFIFFVLKYSGKKRYEKFNCNVESNKWIAVDNLSFIWQYKEIFTDESYKFNSKSQSPIIYDCGSNIGISCLYFLTKYQNSKIIAFEPDPLVFSTLKENITKNGFNSRVELNEKAVWTSEGELNFFSDGADSGFVFSNKIAGNKSVKSISLKSFLEKETIVDMLKIDIEGAESEVIPDIKSELYKVQNLFIEYHSFRNKKQNLGEILDILSKEGFRYYLSTQNNRKSPLINFGKHPEMDYQTNIFAYR